MMHHHPHHPWPLPSSPTPLLLPFLLSLFLSSFLPPSFSDVHYLQLYKACSTTRQFSCGNRIISFSYPFRHQESPPQCGYPDAALSCNDTDHTLTIDIGNKPYRVKDDNIDSATNLVTVVDRDFVGNPCPRPSETTTLGPAPFEYTDDDVNATFFIDCPANLPSPLVSISCLENIAAGRRSYYWLGNGRLPYGQMNTCEISFVQVPTTRTAFDQSTTYGEDYAEALQEGFTLKWPAEIAVWCSACNGSGGVCGYESSKPTCFCSDGSATDGSCHKRSHTKKIIIIGVSVGVGGLVIVSFLGLFLYRRKRRNQLSPVLLSRRASSEPISSKKDPELGDGQHYGTQVFEYEELQEATDGFNASNEVGEGGFGTVYKGNLRDGRTVAIKRLFENNFRRVEQFMTEVDILSSHRHPNLVSLYGCTSRRSRQLLLVYEYVPNGTVADHLHGPRAREEGLSWPVRMSIAIETAEALSYLHAVTPPIIHRDVKTNNILLDHRFRVKVADFGLSRLFPLNVTHVSTVPQGTPGYVDPEYHRCYQLTDKSDVYSFGVVLVELMASKPAVDITRQRHEINLAKMAIDKIQNEELDQLVDPKLWRQSNGEVIWMIRQVAEVAFGCLQEEGDMRPTMKEVLEALRGIQGKGSNRKKGAEAGDAIAKDDDCSLQRERPQHSPDTVTTVWESRLTTPNASV
ncbi:hypothetical protein OPV22_019858 [Ensete ventricosum]|uniref:Protein kinase domain-containing protein n=1 Tax=Ensete ventricosum TaxID=4639 RepID=A0AAV8PBK1_ENSVE|nr:hypothetical protein OPV22_019858 [Ensete ventricosum]